MSISQKLHIIQQLSGFTQTALAQKLGVSLVTLNRWINSKAIPRKKAEERIDAFYRECTGLAEIPAEVLEAKKLILLNKAAHSVNVLSDIMNNPDIRDQFVLVLTFTSNSIEGSTLTEAETAVVLFQNTPLPDKTFIEQLEAKNHQSALLYLFHHLSQKKQIDEDLIFRLHSMLMNGIQQDAGFYRRHGVRIVGADVPTANYLMIPSFMEKFVTNLQQQQSKDIIEFIATMHARFEQIHPFSDGNGRIGRLLMHATLLKENLPPVVVRPEKKRFYYTYLHKAQQPKPDSTLLQNFLCDGVLEGWDIVNRKI